MWLIIKIIIVLFTVTILLFLIKITYKAVFNPSTNLEGSSERAVQIQGFSYKVNKVHITLIITLVKSQAEQLSLQDSLRQQQGEETEITGSLDGP